MRLWLEDLESGHAKLVEATRQEMAVALPDLLKIALRSPAAAPADVLTEPERRVLAVAMRDGGERND